MNTAMSKLPSLPLDEWEQSKMTLHLYLQIAGKIRMASMPRRNHWWNLTFYVSPRGLTTHAIPFNKGLDTFEITLDFLRHQVDVMSSQGELRSFQLHDGLSVASFYQQLFTCLNELGIEVEIVDKPYDLPVTRPFPEITEYSAYQQEYVQRFWRILMWVDGVFKEFSGRFYGKTCPVHLYWHHMDLAVTRFSGKRGPELQADMNISEKDAYSHEVISFGFWAGDDNVRGPAFYSYVYPSPQGLDKQPLKPASASWVDSNGSSMAMLMYDDLRQEDDPRQALLDFMETAYQAGARLANWDVDDFAVPPLSEL